MRLSAPSSRGAGHWQVCPPGELLQVWEQPPFWSLHSSMSKHTQKHTQSENLGHDSCHCRDIWKDRSEQVNSSQTWQSLREPLTHTGVAIDVQLVAGPAGALEGSQSVGANVFTGPTQHGALIHIWGRERHWDEPFLRGIQAAWHYLYVISAVPRDRWVGSATEDKSRVCLLWLLVLRWPLYQVDLPSSLVKIQYVLCKYV